MLPSQGNWGRAPTRFSDVSRHCFLIGRHRWEWFPTDVADDGHRPGQPTGEGSWRRVSHIPRQDHRSCCGDLAASSSRSSVKDRHDDCTKHALLRARGANDSETHVCLSPWAWQGHARPGHFELPQTAMAPGLTGSGSVSRSEPSACPEVSSPTRYSRQSALRATGYKGTDASGDTDGDRPFERVAARACNTVAASPPRTEPLSFDEPIAVVGRYRRRIARCGEPVAGVAANADARTPSSTSCREKVSDMSVVALSTKAFADRFSETV